MLEQIVAVYDLASLPQKNGEDLHCAAAERGGNTVQKKSSAIGNELNCREDIFVFQYRHSHLPIYLLGVAEITWKVGSLV